MTGASACRAGMRARLAALLAAAISCGGSDVPRVDRGEATRERPPAVVTSVASPVGGAATSDEGRETLVATARARVAAARPGFTEWRADQYARATDDPANPVPPLGPVLADLDGDGAPDVVLDGWDSHGELRPVLLSNGGKPLVANLTEGPDLTVPPAPRDTRLRAVGCEWKGRKRRCVELVSIDASGRVASSVSYLWVDGHFSELVDGE